MSEFGGPLALSPAILYKPISTALRILQEQHHGRNKPFMQEVVDNLTGTWLQLSLANCSSGTSAKSMAAPSFRSVSLGTVLDPPGDVTAKSSLMFVSSLATSPAPPC